MLSLFDLAALAPPPASKEVRHPFKPTVREVRAPALSEKNEAVLRRLRALGYQIEIVEAGSPGAPPTGVIELRWPEVKR